MTDTEIEAKIRKLGSEWPVPSASDLVLQALSAKPAIEQIHQHRRWPLALLIGSVATAASLLLALLVQFGSPQTLQAAVQQTLEKAGEAFLLIENLDGKLEEEPVGKIWFDKSRGFRAEFGNRVTVDDGTANWTWTKDDGGEQIVLQRPTSSGSAMIAEMFDLSHVPKDWRKQRSEKQDQTVNGASCIAYAIDLPAPSKLNKDGTNLITDVSKPARRVVVLVDEKERPLRLVRQRRAEDRWMDESRITIDYNAHIAPQSFDVNYPEESRVVDVKEGMDGRFPLNMAVAKAEVEGLLFAVHKIVPLKDGLYYVVSSVRGTPDFLEKYPPRPRRLNLHYTALDVAGHRVTTGTPGDYHVMGLLHVEWYGTEYSWWIITPRKFFTQEEGGTRNYLPNAYSRTIEIGPGQVRIPLYAYCYHPNLQDARGVSKMVCAQIEAKVPSNEADWLETIRGLRRDAEYIAELWGESSSPFVFGSLDGNRVRAIPINDISDQEYVTDLQKLHKQLLENDKVRDGPFGQIE